MRRIAPNLQFPSLFRVSAAFEIASHIITESGHRMLVRIIKIY